ncbi:MAG: alanine--tRNA ligase-related protein [Nitrososphaeria archaeon]
MTELLYLKDSYIKEFAAEIIDDLGDSVILDKTAFYPGGGGQPNDGGWLLLDEKRLDVKKVEKREDLVLHFVNKDVGTNISGKKVKGLIDWDKRYTYMKYHTAIHLLDALLRKNFGKAFLTGGQIFLEKARVDVDYPDLNKTMMPEIESMVNNEIKKGREVVVRFLSKEEAEKIPDLARTKPGQELLKKLETVRVVEIVGLDMQMDGGTHVKNINEIGGIRITNFENKGSHNKRIEFALV